MDPLDQRLTDAGAAWRQTQPEPPDLDRMIVALRRRRSGLFQGRLMYTFVAGLLVAAALAVAPAAGSFLQQLQVTPPVLTTTSPSPSPSQTTSPEPTTASPQPTSSPVPSDHEVASDLVDRYEAALVAARWQDAFDLLAPTSLTYEMGFEAFASERAPYFVSVGDRYVLGTPTRVTDWTTYGPAVAGADRARGYLVEVDYPALSNNNAGYEQFVVAPDSGGTWRIWPVR
jgi:hypothetical protein